MHRAILRHFAATGRPPRSSDLDRITAGSGRDAADVLTIISTSGSTAGEPADAVVFVGAESTDGPSADRCCDHFNFFTDRHTASAWAADHPHIPGQILDQAEALALGVRLFGSLVDGDS